MGALGQSPERPARKHQNKSERGQWIQGSRFSGGRVGCHGGLRSLDAVPGRVAGGDCQTLPACWNDVKEGEVEASDASHGPLPPLERGYLSDARPREQTEGDIEIHADLVWRVRIRTKRHGNAVPCACFQEG